MKQLLRLLFFLAVLPAGNLSAQHGDTSQALYSMTYIVGENGIVLNNDLVTVTGFSSFFRESLHGRLLLPDEEYGIQYFKGKWRLQVSPVEAFYQNKRWQPSSGNFMNYLDDSSCFWAGHDHISLKIRVKSTAWTDTLDRSQQLITLNFVTDDPRRAIAILKETDACVLGQDFAGALLKFAPVRAVLDKRCECFIEYYYDYLCYRRREQERAALYGDQIRKKPPGYDPWKAGEPEYQKKDLDVHAFRNGDPINEAKTREELESFGKRGMPAMLREGKTVFYNHYAVTDPRELAPEGWHIPDSAEWIVLRDRLRDRGMTSFIGKDHGDGTFWVSTNDHFMVANSDGEGAGSRMVLRSCCDEVDECCQTPEMTTLLSACRVRCIRFKTSGR
jgi:hypothetical protein